MLPPSATVAVALSETVVVSIVSVTVVVAAAGFTTRFSKPPPVALAMVSETGPASTTASSPGAGSVSVALDALVGMVIVWLFDSVTVTAEAAGLVSVAV